MSAFFSNQGQQSQAELMENYMQFCLFQKQQEHQKQNVDMFEQFMKHTNNNTMPANPNEVNEVDKKSNTSIFDEFMKKQNTQQRATSFIPFDIDNFNGDGLQKSFDLAYQNESKRLNDM